MSQTIETNPKPEPAPAPESIPQTVRNPRTGELATELSEEK